MQLKKKIVFIEDDKILSDILSEGLTNAGFNVSRAFDGKEGLRLVNETKPDLILLDIMLPMIDGLTLARKFKNEESTQNIPIIILTALDKAAPLAEALESGVYEYIVKSDFKPEQIVEKVKERLGKS